MNKVLLIALVVIAAHSMQSANAQSFKYSMDEFINEGEVSTVRDATLSELILISQNLRVEYERSLTRIDMKIAENAKLILNYRR